MDILNLKYLVLLGTPLIGSVYASSGNAVSAALTIKENPLIINNEEILSIEEGAIVKVENPKQSDNSKKELGIIINSGGTLNLNGGMLTSTGTLLNKEGGTVNFFGGTFTAVDNFAFTNFGGTVNIHNGKINIQSSLAESSNIFFNSQGTINIFGGTIRSSTLGGLHNSGKMYIRGGVLELSAPGALYYNAQEESSTLILSDSAVIKILNGESDPTQIGGIINGGAPGGSFINTALIDLTEINFTPFADRTKLYTNMPNFYGTLVNHANGKDGIFRINGDNLINWANGPNQGNGNAVEFLTKIGNPENQFDELNPTTQAFCEFQLEGGKIQLIGSWTSWLKAYENTLTQAQANVRGMFQAATLNPVVSFYASLDDIGTNPTGDLEHYINEQTIFENIAVVQNIVNFAETAAYSEFEGALNVTQTGQILLPNSSNFNLKVYFVDLYGHIGTDAEKNKTTEILTDDQKPSLELDQNAFFTVHGGEAKLMPITQESEGFYLLYSGNYAFNKEGITTQAGIGLQSCISEGVLVWANLYGQHKKIVKTVYNYDTEVESSDFFSLCENKTNLLDPIINRAENVVDVEGLVIEHNQLYKLIDVSISTEVDIYSLTNTNLEVSIVSPNKELTFITGDNFLTVRGDLTNVMFIKHISGAKVIYANPYSLPQEGIILEENYTPGEFLIGGETDQLFILRNPTTLNFANSMNRLSIASPTTIKCDVTL